MRKIKKFSFQCPIHKKALIIDYNKKSIKCKNKSCKAKYKIIKINNKLVPCLIDDLNFDTVFNYKFLKPIRIFDKNKSYFFRLANHIKSKINNFLNEKYSPPYKEITKNKLKSLIKNGKNKCLIIGSGNRNLPNSIFDNRLNIIGCDLYPGKQVDFIADAHYLPLKENSINIIFLQAVLEHVLEPQKVVDECYRVLSKEGIIISEAPFLQGIHENEYDFFRFSPSAHCFLFKKFEIISHGPLRGAGLSFIWILRGFVSKYIGMKISKIIFFPLMIVSNLNANRKSKATWDYCNSSYVVAIKEVTEPKKYYHKNNLKLYEPKDK